MSWHVSCPAPWSNADQLGHLVTLQAGADEVRYRLGLGALSVGLRALQGCFGLGKAGRGPLRTNAPPQYESLGAASWPPPAATASWHVLVGNPDDNPATAMEGRRRGVRLSPWTASVTASDVKFTPKVTCDVTTRR